jgi:hypothetical protein
VELLDELLEGSSTLRHSDRVVVQVFCARRRPSEHGSQSRRDPDPGAHSRGTHRGRIAWRKGRSQTHHPAHQTFADATGRSTKPWTS